MGEVASAIRPGNARRIIALAAGKARNPTIVTAAIFAASGAAFAIGNLMLARVLPMLAFGRFSLEIALFNVMILIVPLGIDQFMLRHKVDPGPRLLARLLPLASLGAILSGVAAHRWMGLPASESWALAWAIGAGAMGVPVSASLRAQGRAGAALPFTTGASWLLLAIGALALAVRFTDATTPLWLFAGGNVLLSTAGWALLFSDARIAPGHRVDIDWAESLSLLGVIAVGTILLQIERLIVPWRLGLADLASFSVLASSAIFPFRLLLAGAGYALVPRLRAAPDARARKAIIGSELAVIAPLAAIGSIAIVAIAPTAIRVLTAGAYQPETLLIACACLNGAAKLAQSLATSVVQGCGTRAAMASLNRLTLLGLALVVAGGVAGAPWRLEGVLLGISAASLAATLPVLRLAARSLRS